MNSSANYPNIVFIVSRFPYPLEKGDKLRSYYQLKELSKTCSVHLIALSDKPVNPSDLGQLTSFCATVTIHHISKLSIFWNTLLAFFGKKPLQVGYFYNSLIHNKIIQQLSDLKPDHIISQLIRTTEYTKNYHHCPKTLDYMDALSKGIERRIEKAPWFIKWLFRMESKRLKNYERIIFDYFENKSIISEQDLNYIFHPDRKKIMCIPNGIDNRFFEFNTSKTPEFELVFVGNMSYAPNVDAAKYIHSNLLSKLPSLRLLIAGATPHPSIVKIAQHSSQITLAGWVDDIREAYTNGAIFIAPMMIGTGMQNKLLEAMALGIPCVTTDLANNAIKAKHNESIIVANTANEMINAIQELLSNPEKCASIGKLGKEFVANNYSWEMSTKKLVEVVQKNTTDN